MNTPPQSEGGESSHGFLCSCSKCNRQPVRQEHSEESTGERRDPPMDHEPGFTSAAAVEFAYGKLEADASQGAVVDALVDAGATREFAAPFVAQLDAERRAAHRTRGWRMIAGGCASIAAGAGLIYGISTMGYGSTWLVFVSILGGGWIVMKGMAELHAGRPAPRWWQAK